MEIGEDGPTSVAGERTCSRRSWTMPSGVEGWKEEEEEAMVEGEGTRTQTTGSRTRFVPLWGVHGQEPMCYLLEVDAFVFLLDCGWDDRTDVMDLKELETHVDKVDAVLVSHADTKHLGALPYAVGKLGLNCPVYATLPVHKMGQMVLYDLYLAKRAEEEYETFNLNDVDRAFGMFNPMRYAQQINLTGKGEGITITPFPAGHSVGGTTWRITKEAEDILYAVDYNHRKERHLNGAALHTFNRPAVLITDAYNGLTEQTSRKLRDRTLVAGVMQTLRSGGNVLIPVDTATRVLELLLVLDSHWEHQKIGLYSLVLLNNVAYNVVEFAKSMLEFMNSDISKSFEHTRDNVFDCKNVHLCHSLEELEELPDQPKVVLASMASLEAGLGRNLLVDWASNADNLILFVERAQAGTLSSFIQTYMDSDETEDLQMRIKMGHREALDEVELVEFQEAEEARKEEELLADAVYGDAGLDIMDIEEGNEKAGGIQEKARAVGQVLNEGFETPEGAVAPLFPFPEEDVERDEYGEILDPAEFAGDEDPSPTSAPEGLEGELDGEDATMLEESPTKVVVEEMDIIVRASLQYIDFEGRSDERSIKNIVTQVQPRQLILVHGSPEATQGLKSHFETVLKSVHAPQPLEPVTIDSVSASYRLRLTEDFMRMVRFSRVAGNYQVAWVDGELKEEEGGSGLSLVPSQGALQAVQKAVFVGETRLAELKEIIQSTLNLSVHFIPGGLVCGDRVVIRKQGARLSFHGALSQDYYRVRDVVYAQYHIC